ncbi:hypothetical protein Fmac_028230 [Flemingia macrophylla]|uniref:RING-type domain-containing protein n=1 Tax=Flemingia macrophylla TaxID=520843 RepID=A0ABD1L6Y2_9FABA
MEGRQRVTLYDRMTGGSRRESLARLMLDDVVLKKREGEASRRPTLTLQDVIREEEPNNANANANAKNRRSWKAFKEKLGLKRSAWSSSSHHEHTNGDSPQGQTDVVNGSSHGSPGVPLMNLLDLCRASDDDDNDNNDDNNHVDHSKRDHEEPKECFVDYKCCVCMVRHKGAAFIPCGHTFCRVCSTQISLSRGSCPLCNNLILEILHLF